MSESLKNFLKRWLITTLAVLVATQIISEIRYDDWQSLVLATLTLGLLNSFLRPVLMLLSLPILLLTLGLFTLVINAGLLMLVGKLFKGFHVESFSTAFWGSVVISLVSVLLNAVTGGGRIQASIPRGPGQGGGSPGPGKPKRPGDAGPVLDV